MSTLKTKLAVLILLAMTLLFIGCDNNEETIIVDSDPAPAAPQGLISVTGDGEVYLFWNGPYERDIDFYRVWRSFDPVDNYVVIGTVDALPNPDLDLIIYEFIDDDAALVNGRTYYYAVTSVDLAGHESDLSAEDVLDTPRPEGNVELFDEAVDSLKAGYDFDQMTRVSSASVFADVFVDADGDGILFLNVRDSFTDIQDVGYTEDFDEIGWAPINGWSEKGWVELIDGHTYIIWTRDENFAKLWVEVIGANSVGFRYAYQTVVNNPELSPYVGNDKPVHDSDYLNRESGANSSSQ